MSTAAVLAGCTAHHWQDVYEIKHTASEWVLMSGGVLGFKDMAVDKDAVLQVGPCKPYTSSRL